MLHPFQHKASVLAGSQPPSAVVSTTSKQELSSLPPGQSQVLVNRLTRLVANLEPDGPAGLFLPDGRAICRTAAQSHVIDADGDHIAAAQFAVDR